MKKSILLGAMIVPLVALATHFVARTPQAEQGLFAGTFDPPRAAPAFTLEGSNSSRFSLRDYLGKVVILEFGYTYCQDVCPITLGHLTQVYRKLGGAAHDVQLIYITVDPARDNPARLREHLSAFNPSFLGATGNPDELATVQKAYGVVARQVAAESAGQGYAVDHSSSLYLVDRHGKLRGLVPFGTPVDDIVHDLRYLLKPEA